MLYISISGVSFRSFNLFTKKSEKFVMDHVNNLRRTFVLLIFDMFGLYGSQNNSRKRRYAMRTKVMTSPLEFQSV